MGACANRQAARARLGSALARALGGWRAPVWPREALQKLVTTSESWVREEARMEWRKVSRLSPSSVARRMRTSAPLAAASRQKSSIVVPTARISSRELEQPVGNMASLHQRQPGPVSSRQRRRGSMRSAFITIVSVPSPQNVGSSCVWNCSDSGKYGSMWPEASASAKCLRPCLLEKATSCSGRTRRKTDFSGRGGRVSSPLCCCRLLLSLPRPKLARCHNAACVSLAAAG